MPQIKIDDFIPINQPDGMDELDVLIRFDETEKTLLIDTNGAELKFSGDAYDYLVRSRKENGYNGVHKVEISMLVEGVTFSTVFNGNLFITDCEFDLKRGFCTVSLVDDGYNSHIKNNRKVEANFTGGKTMVGETMANDSVIVPARVRLFNPPSSSASGIPLKDRYVYRVQDVMKYLISFISDNDIAFKSDFFDNLKDNDSLSYGLIRGKNLRDDDVKVHKPISFYNLFIDVSSLFNLILTIQTIEGVPTLRVEPISYFRDAGIVFAKNTTSEITRSFIQELLYSTVEIGSLEGTKENLIGDMSYLPPFDFAKDNYYLASKSNIDNTKILGAQTLIYDSNVIEDVITNANTDFDDEWFLMAFDESTGNFRTTGSDILSNGDYYYNGELTNKAVVNRYKFQGASVRTVGVADGDVIAGAGNVVPTDFIGATNYTAEFHDVTFDPLNLWNTSTSRYTAIDEGVINVNMRLDHQLVALVQDFSCGGGSDSHPDHTEFGYTVGIQIYKNGVLVRDSDGRNFGDKFKRMYHQNVMAQGRFFSNLSFQLYMEPADYLQVNYDVQYGFISDTAFFPDDTMQYVGNGILYDDIEASKRYIVVKTAVGCLVEAKINMLASCSMIVATQGSINRLPITDETVDGFFVNRFEFEDTISNKQINDFLTNPQKAMNLKNKELNLDLKVWAYLVSINLKSGKTKFEMINNIANQ